MGGYFDYRPYFEDIQDSLSDVLTNQDALLTEIQQQEEKEFERHKEICHYVSLIMGFILIGAVIAVIFK